MQNIGRSCDNRSGSVRNRNPALRQGGFTLVEAALALFILCVTVVALSEAMGRCLAVLRVSRNYQTARVVLARGEAEHPLVGTNTVEQNTVSETAYDRGFTFSRELKPMDGEESLYTVYTRVSWAEKGGKASEEVVSCIYSPKKDELQ